MLLLVPLPSDVVQMLLRALLSALWLLSYLLESWSLL
jgi:hypothetical protein